MGIEFKEWPKIPRENPFTVTITEKIDGTNACIVIQDGKIVAVQSRNRFITPEEDNYGFAGWVERNSDQLETMGDGYHYGEWAGLGIQGDPHRIGEKKFFLFNTFRWNALNPNLPLCCNVVPVLFQGEMKADTIPSLLKQLSEREDQDSEGVIVYYHAFSKYTKHTIKTPQGKWRE